jgi:putative oxidoreductase
MYFFQVLISLLGRISLSAVFITMGIKHIVYWKNSEEILITALCDWHVYANDLPYADKIVEFALNWIPVFLGCGVFFLLLGGALVFLGYRARLGAVLLILFLVPTTIIMHPFWSLHAQKKDEQEMAFIKNTAILGGLLMVVAYGNGIRARRKLPPEPPMEVQR